jgi:site-specific DNA recombinase
LRKVKIIEPLANETRNIEKLNVAAYCRVSTDNAKQLDSLDAQIRHYESYIKSNNKWTLAGVYYDEGMTGTSKDKRTGLLNLIKDCKEGKVNLIITKSISRLARNTADCLELVRSFTELGVCLYFEKENINTQSMESELMLSILAGLAENESLSISENTKWSIRRRFQNGTYKVSDPPYGYDARNGKLVINEEEANIVRHIFSETLAGKGSQKIANELNKRNIKSKRNSKWTANTILGMLQNERYIGDALYQKTYMDSNYKRHTNYELVPNAVEFE